MLNYYGTKYIKIENVEQDISKKFAAYFTQDGIQYCSISIMDDNEKLQEDIKKANDLYNKIFTDDELKGGMIVALVIVSLYW